MRIPKRRTEEEARQKRTFDHHLTAAAIARLKKDLINLEREVLPPAAAELRRTAEMGDLSENAAYQYAKDNLRRIHNRILSLRSRIANAIVIEHTAGSSGIIELGSRVTISRNGSEKKYEIVGSAEAKPANGRVSHQSPLGQALLGHRAGDEIFVTSPKQKIAYQIVTVD